MSNWFSSHPAYTILGHTAVVATITWGISNFVIDESKVNLCKAQIENELAVNRQLEAKIGVLEQQQTALADENRELKDWLNNDETSFPALRNKISSLENALSSVDGNAAPTEGAGKLKDDGAYTYSEDLLKGQAFIDPRTNVTLGVSDIGIDRTAKIYLFLPGKGEDKMDDVRPGASWLFNYGDRQFKITLTKIEWIGSQFSVSVVEVR